MDHLQQDNHMEQNMQEQIADQPSGGKPASPAWLAKTLEQIRPKTKKQRWILSAAVIVFILAAVLIAGSAADPLCGKWDLDGTTVYVFDGRGGGALELPGAKYEFRYKIDENTVSIDFADDKVRDISYEFAVDSDKLTIERKEKNDTVTHELQKQAETG